jgi:hypothetical protein
MCVVRRSEKMVFVALYWIFLHLQPIAESGLTPAVAWNQVWSALQVVVLSCFFYYVCVEAYAEYTRVESQKDALRRQGCSS